jgi:hypothetical protein
MADIVHIDFGVDKKCINPDSYGEICVKCNCCGRFGEENMWIRRYNMYWRQLTEEIEKHYDEFFMSNLQQKNIASNVKWYAEKILECVEHLDFDNNKPEVEETWTLKTYCLEQEIERLKKELEEK